MKTSAIDRRLEGETTLRQCQLTELYLLDVFVEICQRHKLRYFLDAGTLIGAMRHKGFIPWDDDVDVGMPIEDYRRFLKIAPMELPEDLMLQIPGKTAGMIEGFAKLTDRCSFLCQPNTDVRVPAGIYMDIFPFIKFPDLPMCLERFFCHWGYQAITASNLHKNLPHRYVLGLIHSAFMSVCWRIVFKILSFVCQCLRLFSPTILHDTLASTYVSGRQISGNIEWFFPTVEQEFEGKKYQVPNNADAILTRRYGDWRMLPPEEKRWWHASIICPCQAPDVPWARTYSPLKKK